MSLQSESHPLLAPAEPGSIDCLSQTPHLEKSVPPFAGDVLAPGFAITVAAWIVAYLSRMPSVNASGQVTIFSMLAMVFLGGLLAARYSAKGAWAALLAGLVSGILDILIVGSILHDVSGDQKSIAPAAGHWIGGSILLNTLVAGAGGLVGGLFPSRNRQHIPWPAIFALVLTAATLPLITAGGVVTAFRAGLAVPDWPQSYGYNMFLFPLSKMQSAQGNFYEHAHRLMGTLVGVTALSLAIYIWLADRIAWRKIFTWSIFAAVCIQGGIGALRVTNKSLPLAVVHGIFAQLVFASMATLAAASSYSFSSLARQPRSHAAADRSLSTTLLLAMVFQLTLGALVRHFDVLVLLHITLAAVVALLAVTCGFRAWALHADLRPLKFSGIAVITLVALQLGLGIAALALRPGSQGAPTLTSALWTTAHQANGAILLAACAVLAFWNWRLLIPAPEPIASTVMLPSDSPAVVA